jgi:hypothetical protein
VRGKKQLNLYPLLRPTPARPLHLLRQLADPLSHKRQNGIEKPRKEPSGVFGSKALFFEHSEKFQETSVLAYARTIFFELQARSLELLVLSASRQIKQ